MCLATDDQFKSKRKTKIEKNIYKTLLFGCMHLAIHGEIKTAHKIITIKHEHYHNLMHRKKKTNRKKIQSVDAWEDPTR